MNFINPFLLLFAAAASIPLLLHLFNKQRVKIVEFSTVKYLLSLQKTRMRQVKIRQILLLILRTLALLAIAFAFARPTIEGGYLPALGGKTTTTAVIMIDISGSCQTETNSGSFFERSIEKAEAILKNFAEKEKVVILGFGSTIRYDSGEPTSDFARLSAFLKTLTPSASETEPQVAFARALEILRAATDPNLEVYLLSDFQGDAWRNFEYQSFQAEKLDVKLFLTQTSLDGVSNAAVDKVIFPNQIITAGRSFSVQGEIHNLKEDQPEELLVSLDVNDRRIAQTDLSVPPSGTGRVSFEHTPTEPGYLYGELSIDDDDLLADNRAGFAMRIPSGSKIALVSDDDREAFYLKNALAPSESQSLAKSVQIIGTLQAATANLMEFDAIIVNARGRPQPALYSAVRNFVNTGGSALFLMRPDLEFSAFSDEVAESMFGLEILQAPAVPATGGGRYLLNKLDLAHPLFSPYRQFSGDKLPQAEFSGHFSTRESARSTILARFSDNAPAVLEAAVGKGKALLFTFSLDENYSDLVFRPLSVILLNRSIEYLVSEPLNQRETLIAGTEITRELGPQNARQYSLVTPNGDTTQVEAALRAGAIAFSLGRLHHTGIYRILGDNRVIDIFAVNFPSSESTPEYTDPGTIGAKVAGANVVVLGFGQDPAEAIASARFGTELWKLFLLAGFLFLLAEMAVAFTARQPEVNAG